MKLRYRLRLILRLATLNGPVNIIGTQNVIRASIEANIRLLVDISTDKAVEPHNIYGVSKSCGEKLIVK